MIENPNHIGTKAWRRLSPGRKKQIIKNRARARELLAEWKEQDQKKEYERRNQKRSFA